MSAPKLGTTWAVLAKSETTYGTAVSLSAATDALRQATDPIWTPGYAYSGDRKGNNPGTSGPAPNVAPTARKANGTIGVEVRGYGAAYSASNLPRDFDVLCRAAGMGATVVTTGGSESVTYAPISIPANFKSATVAYYSGGEVYTASGVYANMKLEGKDTGPVIATFDWEGIWPVATVVTDGAPSGSAAYAPTVLPPRNVGVGLTIGTFSAGVIRSWSLDLKRQRGPRLNVNAPDGHGGFSLFDRDVEFKCLLESVTLATGSPFHTSTTFDPYRLQALATQLGLTFTVGSVQYSKFGVTASQAQLIDAKPARDGASAIWDLTFRLATSGGTAEDDLSILFN